MGVICPLNEIGEHSDMKTGVIMRLMPMPIPVITLPRHNEKAPNAILRISEPKIINTAPSIIDNFLPILSAINPVKTAVIDSESTA